MKFKKIKKVFFVIQSCLFLSSCFFTLPELVELKLIRLEQIGGVQGKKDTDGLLLTFNKDPETLTIDNIDLTGATKGKLSGTGVTRIVTLTDVTVPDNESITLEITNPDGYRISGLPLKAVVYNNKILEYSQNEGSSGKTTTKSVEFIVPRNIKSLTMDEIEIIGAEKVELKTIEDRKYRVYIKKITAGNENKIQITVKDQYKFKVEVYVISPENAKANLVEKIGDGYDVTTYDTFYITDMSNLFKGVTNFNQDIGGWDVSNVTNMKGMFYGATSFNQDIGGWDVSNVTNMKDMFAGATSFNQNLYKTLPSSEKKYWDVSNVTDMEGMFKDATSFNQDIGGWDVSSVTNMNYMFYGATSFNQNISGWNEHFAEKTIEHKSFSGSFCGLKGENHPDESWNNDISKEALISMINTGQDLTNVDVSSIEDMSNLFKNKTIIGNIGGWDVSNVTNMSYMFANATNFNQKIGDWDVSKVTNMEGMFGDATNFNQDIGGWDVSSVTTMEKMFFRAKDFNQGIGGWDVSSVTDMKNMFFGAKAFNQNLYKTLPSSEKKYWDVSNVTNMSYMFAYATSFNQDIGGWSVSKVKDMSYMFYGATSFNQDISSWSEHVDESIVHSGFSGERCPLIPKHHPYSSWDDQSG